MGSRKRVAGAVVAAVGAAAIVAPVGGAGAQAPGGRTLTFRELDRGSTFRFVDNPPRSRNRRNPTFSVGDLLAFSNPLADTSGKRMGSLYAHCVVVRRGTFRNAVADCDGMFVLADGSLTARALLRPSQRSTTGAITGGTGAYAGARGSFTSRNVRGGSDDTVTLLG